MVDELPTAPLVIRFATPDDIALINELDTFSASPTRHIHRAMERYFGSVDPSTHERILIFLGELDGVTVAKAELMLPPSDPSIEVGLAPAQLALDQLTPVLLTDAQPTPVRKVGYIKRVVVHPDFRGQRLSRTLLEHIIAYARNELALTALELHVWENNYAAIRLYHSLGFELQHRELYFRLPLGTLPSPE